MRRLCVGVLGFVLFIQIGSAQHEHVRRYSKPVPDDAALAAAEKLNLNMPVMCREWHIWWGAPYGKNAYTPEWVHWKGLQRYGKFDQAKTIEHTVPGLAWRRYLNCAGYPLLGPYDSGQRDIIRWQLQTAKNAGLECLHLHLWPSLWDDGTDMTPIHIIDMAFDVAEELDYPIALHDEIMFRGPDITRGRSVENSIIRTTAVLKRYQACPSLYRIGGMPFYYIQNWNNWITAEDMAVYVSAVEKEVGEVFWVVEGGDDDILEIPEIKAYSGSHVDWFLHTPPYGKGPHPWAQLKKTMEADAAKARAHGKQYCVNLKTRFNNSNDRGEEGRGVISGENGMFLIKALRLAKELNPDFIILAQWNDYEEGAFIEPAWDFDGFNGDPYRYCRIIAAAVGKTFQPANLPDRRCIDPMMRLKLYELPGKGDCGPVFENVSVDGRQISWSLVAEGSVPNVLRVTQKNLLRWTAGEITYQKQPLRLANSASVGDGVLSGKDELRFYLPGLVIEQDATVWIAVRLKAGHRTGTVAYYRSVHENYRVDSRWEQRHAGDRSGFRFIQEDGSEIAWFPLYGAEFNGTEGDITLRLTGEKQQTEVLSVAVWHPGLSDVEIPMRSDMKEGLLPKPVSKKMPAVVCSYDPVGNPGQPVLIWE